MAEKESFITPVFRIAFVNLFEAAKPRDGEDKAPRYGCTAIWNEAGFSTVDKELWASLLKGMDDECLAAFKKTRDALPGNFKKGIRPSEEKDYEGFDAGTVFANLTSLYQPAVWDTGKPSRQIDKEHADQVYAGCYCRADVQVYTYDMGGGKGVAMRLVSVKKVRDGERLDSRGGNPDRFDSAPIDPDWDEGPVGGGETPF